jgi:hypothetical protein
MKFFRPEWKITVENFTGKLRPTFQETQEWTSLWRIFFTSASGRAGLRPIFFSVQLFVSFLSLMHLFASQIIEVHSRFEIRFARCFFQTQNPNLGKFCRALDWKMLIYLWPFGIFTDIWDILWPFGTFCVHLVHFFRFWYHVPRKIWQPCSKCVLPSIFKWLF